MYEMTQFYINGKWVDPQNQNRAEVINPATGKPCGYISMGSSEDVDIAVAAAKGAFKNYSKSTREDRIELFKSILKILEKRHDDIARAIMHEMGAPWKLAKDAQAESVLMLLFQHWRF